jgi:hypothetical protein
MNRSSLNGPIRLALAGWIVGIVGLSAVPAFPEGEALGFPVEPLVVRVPDAIGAPGQQTAIIFRTYASRPVRRGRLSLIAGNGNAGGLAPNGSSPFASVQEARIFSSQGDADDTSLTFNDSTGLFVVDFDSPTFTINDDDGVFAVIFATIGTGSIPGNCWPLNLQDVVANTFLNDPDDDLHPIEIRDDAEICVRALNDPYELEVEGSEVHPGSDAIVEISTSEPYLVESGTIRVQYDPAHFSGPPSLISDLRHGDAGATLSFPAPGELEIEIDSPAPADFNEVPGDVLHLIFPTKPTVPLGTISPLTIVAASSFLEGPGGVALDVTMLSGPIEFAAIPAIFADGFESGDPWIWSRRSP